MAVTVTIRIRHLTLEKRVANGYDDGSRLVQAVAALIDAAETQNLTQNGRSLRESLILRLGGRLREENSGQ